MKGVFLLALVCVLLSAVAQIVLKAGMGAAALTAPRGAAATLAATFLNPLVIGGLALYFLSAVVWLAVLAKLPVSTAYPFVSLGFVCTAALGWLIFGEPISAAKALGIALIVGGVLFVARG